ncbi:hypothetical protein C922_02012 [Plasmodium inui San Antonio 1]|uniref:Uncharacterized protein n=1 Tax=Plasmodium inui San Antonio 1 TaxID=1237626 RepID=W7A983_9APIC|nr:hypothetical protein C922_02012 [Plasmodium inui San Antonio 1]EUD67823.1 hypothetical protein C922_02012 [Plasmodium inui San Antonio 1]
MSSLSRVKLRICKAAARKKLHIFCDEQSYADNLIRLYIYNELDRKTTNEKNPYRENVSKYVGKVTAHLKINRGNGNIIFSVATFLDIFFFNYFKFNHKSKLVFLYSEIRLKYVNKFFQANDKEKRDLITQQQKLNCHSHAIIPLSNRRTFIQDILNQTENLKDLSILICIIRKASSFHTFDCSKILDSLLRKLYSHINNFAVAVKPNGAYSLRYCASLILIDKIKIEQTKTVKIRDLLYSFYQLVYLQRGQKIQFIFLRILAILGKNYAHLARGGQGAWGKAANEANENEANANHATTHSPACNLFLSNKDIEQLFFLLSKNAHLNGHFMHPLVMHFYVKLFSLGPAVTYFSKLIKQNGEASYAFCPISMFPKSSPAYLKFLKKSDVKNHFHTFYQTLSIKYLLKRKINFCENRSSIDHSACSGITDSPRLSHFVLYQNIVNKIIARSFYLYQAKINPKGKYTHKWLHTTTNSAREKYEKNYLYDFTKCKFFYLIYIRAIIRGRRSGKPLGKSAPRGRRQKEEPQKLSTVAAS